MRDDEDSLDAAWAEAEAALPEGWGIGIQVPPGGYPGGYEVGASGDTEWTVQANGPTPAAALRALAAKLREQSR